MNSEPNALPPAGWQPAPYRTDDPRRVSVPLAMTLSLMPGLGQVYLGRYQGGFVNILVVASLIALLNQNVGSLEPLLGFFLTFFWMFNIVDAGRQAHAWNQALLRMEAPGAEAIKEDRMAPLFTGIGLIGLGLLTLVHRVFGLSMEWVLRWWPAALVVAGVVLVWQALRNHAAAEPQV